MKTSNWKFWCQSIRATDAGVYIVEVDQGLKIGFTKKPHHRFSEMHKVGCNIMYRAWFPHDRPHELEKEVHNLLADDKIKNIFWPFSKCQTAPCELFELDYKTAIMLCEKEGIINTFTNLSITGGYLYNLSVYSDGSSGTNFLKVYGVAGATFADTPLLIVPVTHATSVNLSLSGLKALTGISVRATANYTVADNNAPTNGINCNLIFSPLV